MEKQKNNRIIILIVLVIILIIGIIGLICFRCNINTKRKINTIKIRYAYNYGIETAESLNKIQEKNFIDILEINLDGYELETVENLLNKISFEKKENVELVVLGEYEITINNNEKICIDSGANNCAYYEKKGNDGYIINIPEKLVDEIVDIVKKRVDDKLDKFYCEKIIISSPNKKDVNITSKEEVQKLTENLKYVEVNIDENDMKDEKISYMIKLDNGMQVYTYYASTIGYIIDNDKKEYYVSFITNYDKMVKEIYEKNKIV